MRIKKGFMLRKLGKDYMAVAVGDAGKQFNGMIRINEAGSYLWNELKNETTEDELVHKMLARYEDLDEATARADLKEFLDSIAVALEK